MSYLQPRKNNISRKHGHIKPNITILIVTEGNVTEPVYFNWLRKIFRLSSLTIVIVGTGKDPVTLVREAIEEYSKNKYDMVYCLVDRDKHSKERLIIAKDMLFKKKYKNIFRLILSFPSIEYWFILNVPGGSDDIYPYQQPVNGSGSIGRLCKKRLKEKFYQEYDERSKDCLEKFFQRIFTKENRIKAIKKAKEHFKSGIEQRDSINPSTLVFIPASHIELLADSKSNIKLVSQEEYESYIKESYRILIEQNL